MKILKFHTDLVPLVLDGSKTSTWRLFDDKQLTTGDKLELRESGADKPFAHAIITNVVEKSFAELSDEDKHGHEPFREDDEMYAAYSRYYSIKVDKSTRLKIIRFELL